MSPVFKICIALILSSVLSANINLIKKENSDSNTTLLVIGGIHGNEPGGYFAPEILATHYTIKSKNLWIIPTLNKASIIANKRGIHGDMNRKFNHIKNNDKDKKIVEEIKKIILLPNISLILNLHDGHGFYRKKSEGNIYNPDAWGQTCVIDQCKLLRAQPFGDLNGIALTVKDNINKKLLKKHHSFNVKNTNTKNEDIQMQQSLTYFAVKHSKPAFAIETSKNLSSLAQKVFYQLVAIEEYMKIMDIDYTRDFNLNIEEISKIIKNYGTLVINHNFLLNLNNIKKSLSYIPIESKSNEFYFSNPLGEVKKKRGRYLVYIGNKLVTTLRPQYFKMSKNCQNKFKFVVDGKEVSLPKASEFYVNDDFKVIKAKNYRVNVIGYYKKGTSDESLIDISLNNLNKKYSIDNTNKTYRIEIYDNDEFCSMLLVHFK
ncbi:M99 family carboxypeptidase catalytic domain-containing protein [Sulfurimonas autotrophica]|uniref:Putative periplasmic protein n=1 Tax=Sulfurimonas autotrophica (strain ATCC BAA-671 / DSM 16294 / JCM 11897 / OK10) TaxID=563040 RepID=E0URB0_SULAO|nr:M99 family carboxypeptidase catalytic domain-containing protein [Sulfurimonas autotrophica]ADN08920.1 putative periplasmic protein [Sulfurimonas autotrophica DSM 16294]